MHIYVYTYAYSVHKKGVRPPEASFLNDPHVGLLFTRSWYVAAFVMPQAWRCCVQILFARRLLRNLCTIQ